MKWIVMLLLLPLYAQAACSGSGASYSCTSGSSAANVNSAISSVSDGGTVTLDAGTYNMTAVVSMNGRNGVTLKCATVGGCTWNRTGDFIYIDSIPSDRTNLIRISGFIFNGNQGTAKIWIFGANDIEKLRIDNNTFQGGDTGDIDILIGETSSNGCIYGVIDHNTFEGTTNRMGVKSLHCGAGWVAGLSGSKNNLFIEDNTWDFTAYDDLGSGGIDAWLPGGVVIRYNTFFNARIVNHSYCHDGPANVEVYGNSINAPDSIAPNYRNIHLQGPGEAIVFGNTIYGGHFAIQSFRSDSSTATSEGSCNSVCNGTVTGTGADAAHANDGNRSGKVGYPCWHQAGRDVNAKLMPIYTWNNATDSGTRVDPGVESGTWTGLNANCADTDAGRVNCHIQKNRDIYIAGSITAQTSSTSPFDGTTGMGFGTYARRPTTCSTGLTDTPDAGNGGVGYYATDVGVLYRCSSTNTWVRHYIPYVYPHPLVSGKPEPAMNIRITEIEELERISLDRELTAQAH